MNNRPITAPGATRQIGFHQLLVSARKMWLIDALAEASSRVESPTTTSWFDVAHVLGRRGDDWDEFCSRMADVIGIPLASPRKSKR